MADPYIQVAGKSRLFIATVADPTTIHEVGEQVDDTQIEIQHYLHDVPGDSHGGQQGPPIERQVLGMIARARFSLCTWNPEVLDILEKHVNVFSQAGRVLDSEVGALLLRDNSFRVCIVPSKENITAELGYDHFLRNFVCATLSSPIQIGQGTKWSLLQFSMEAHRAPRGHAKAKCLWDRDRSGIPELEEAIK